jgi:hypothetical protein
LDVGDKKWAFMDFIRNTHWSKEGLKMENCSINLLASARALAKLGAFMAH